MANNVAEVNLGHLPTLEWKLINPQLQEGASNFQGEGLVKYEILNHCRLLQLACELQIQNLSAEGKKNLTERELCCAYK